MTVFYGNELVASLNGQWTEKWLTAILDVIEFLSDDTIMSDNIRVLESLMTSIDSQTQTLFSSGGGGVVTLGYESFSEQRKPKPKT
jgi:hypothetical protein